VRDLRQWHHDNAVRALHEAGWEPDEITEALDAVRSLHAHELAEKIRTEAARVYNTNSHDWEAGTQADEWDAAADFIDPEVS
jgi:hypothetical protein